MRVGCIVRLLLEYTFLIFHFLYYGHNPYKLIYRAVDFKVPVICVFSVLHGIITQSLYYQRGRSHNDSNI